MRQIRPARKKIMKRITDCFKPAACLHKIRRSCPDKVFLPFSVQDMNTAAISSSCSCANFFKADDTFNFFSVSRKSRTGEY
jgi:hypothetical protein